MASLDLRTDFAEFYAFVADRVRSFDPDENDGPGEEGAITRIDVGYSIDQGGWACLVFDTRPDAEPDGEWNGSIEGNDLERPHWAEACEALEGSPLTLILPDGSRRELPPGGDGLWTAVGEMLKGVLIRARADGLFATLPIAPRCELGVEEQDGAYGWPIYEERGRENLV